MAGRWVLTYEIEDGDELKPIGQTVLHGDGRMEYERTMDPSRAMHSDFDAGIHKNHGVPYSRDFVYAPYIPATISEAIGIAVGAASVCFNPPGGAVFDERFASSIVDALIEQFEKFAQERVQQERVKQLYVMSYHNWRGKWAFHPNAMHTMMGVEPPSTPRYTVELVPTGFRVFANDLLLGNISRLENTDQWYFNSLNRHTRRGLREAIANRINQVMPPGTDKIDPASGDLVVNVREPEFYVPESGDDEDVD